MFRTYFFFFILGSYLFLSIFAYAIYFILGLISKKTQYRFVHNSATLWGKLMVALSSSKITVLGKDKLPDGNVLYVSNHQGNYDIPIFLGYIPKAKGFLAKIELAHIPIFSQWMKALGCLFLDRGNLKQSLRIILKGIEQLKSGDSLVVFPEGTRSKGNSMGDFKKGSLKMAIKANVPIVPVTINGTYTMYEVRNKITKSKAIFTIHDPIYPDKLTKDEKNNLSEIVKEIIASELPK